MNKNFLKALSGYASDFHAVLEVTENDNIVASPLGSWMLLASLASSTDFSHNTAEKTRIEAILHTSVANATIFLEELLQIEQLNYISHVWYREQLLSKYPNVINWLHSNEIVPSTASIPEKTALDIWTKEHTHDLIEKFPLDVDENMFFLMANVIYSKFNWEHSFRSVKDSAMSAVWNVEDFLFSNKTRIEFYTVDGKEYLCYPVAAEGTETVLLTLPIHHTVSDAGLIAAAHRIAIREEVERVSYAAMEPEEGVYLFEQRVGTTPLVINVTLPAWVADSKHDLYAEEAFGYQALSEALAYGAKEEWEAKAAQSAVAKFKKDGFEAAAVTAFGMMRASAVMPPRMTQDVLTVNFSKPFAFICTIDGVPAFSGIIKKADKNIE